MINPFSVPAIVAGNHEILRDIDQTGESNTRVAFSTRICETFTRTVSRNEVLQYVQTFTEVSGDRCLDIDPSGLA